MSIARLKKATVGFSLLFLSGYIAPSFAVDISGNWYGIVTCDGYKQEFDLKIQQNGQRVAAEFITDGQHKRAPKINIKLAGGYLEKESYLILRSTGGHYMQSMMIKGGIDPQKMRLAASFSAPKYGKICSYAVAGRKEFKKQIKSIVKNTKFKVRRGFTKGGTECTGNILKWFNYVEPKWLSKNDRIEKYSQRTADHARYAALEMMQDKHLKKFFRKGLKDFSAKELADFSKRFENGCRGKISNRKMKNNVPRYISSILWNGRDLSRTNLYIYPYVKEILGKWKKAASANLEGATSREKQRYSQLADQILLPLWPVDRGDLKGEILTAQNDENSAKLLNEVKMMAAERPMRFETLVRLLKYLEDFRTGSIDEQLETHSKVRKRGRTNSAAEMRRRIAAAKQNKAKDSVGAKASNKTIFVTKSALTEGKDRAKNLINSHLKTSLGQFLTRTITAEGVRRSLNPLYSEGYKSLLSYIDAGQRMAADQMIMTRRSELMQGFVAREQKIFAQNKANSHLGAAYLKQLVGAEGFLENQYKNLLTETAFAGFNTERAEHRREMIETNGKALSSQLQQARNVAALDQIMTAHMMDDDRRDPRAASLIQLYNKRIRVFSPFTDYAEADYLNAIYRGDIAALRRYDLEFADHYIKNAYGIERLIKMMNMMQKFVPKAAKKEPMTMKVFRRKLTLMKSVVVTYLFNYERISKRCLRPDHATVSRISIKVISREKTLVADYKVNREFEPLLRRVGLSSPNSFSASMSDKLVTNGRVQQVRRSTANAMRKMDCNGKTIKQFERNMRIIYAKYY